MNAKTLKDKEDLKRTDAKALSHVIWETAKFVKRLMRDESRDRYNMMLGSGVDTLKSCGEDYLDDWAKDGGVNINRDLVDWDIAYLVLRDWYTKSFFGLDTVRTVPVIAQYMGLNLSSGDEYKALSAATKVKMFGAESLTDVSDMTGIPTRTLNDWFVHRKLSFHAVMEFAVGTTNRIDGLRRY